MNINEINELREQITDILSRLDELERAEKQKGTNMKFDPTEIYNEDDIPLGECGSKKFYILVDDQGAQLVEDENDGSDYDEELYNNNNYIPSEYHNAAEELLNIIRFNMFLTRQKLIYCPDFVPDKDHNKVTKAMYTIRYDSVQEGFYPDFKHFLLKMPTVCFPSEEIAEKICAKLNDYLDKYRKEV